MPIFSLIRPEIKQITFEEYKDYKQALKTLGLSNLGVDHGTIFRNNYGSLNIFVYEFSLLDAKYNSFWSLNFQLFNGPGLLFFADDFGETKNINKNLQEVIESLILFIGDSIRAENFIQQGLVFRPQTSINGIITWQWKGNK